MSDLYEKIIYQDDEKGKQLKLVLSEFKGIEYLHLRRYYLSYDEGYKPSSEGASFPASITSIYALLDGLVEICATNESLQSLEEHLIPLLDKLKNERKITTISGGSS